MELKSALRSLVIFTLLLGAPRVSATPSAKAPTHSIKKSTRSTAHFCMMRWHRVAKPTVSQSQRCARYFLLRAYGGDDLDEMLDYDAPTPPGMLLRFSGDQLDRMAAHVAKLCGKKGCTAAKNRLLFRARDLFVGASGELFGLRDNLGGGGVGPSLIPFLKTIAAGKEIVWDDLPAGLSFLALRKLRNAPFARHGRSFKNKDLDVFFFNKRSDKNGVLPFKRAKGFKTSMLTAADRTNVRHLRRLERVARKKVSSW